MSETTPLNEWPVEKLYVIRNMINFYLLMHDNIKDNDIIDTVNIAIKDAEEKLNELPFK